MSTVVLDTITGKSTSTTVTIGSTPVVSASANSMTIRGEGSAQTSIQQGLCKSWFNFDGKSTVSIRDSFNVASMTDRGTGLYTQTFTTAMGNANFVGTGSSQDSAGDVDGRNRMIVSEPNSTAAAFVNSFDTGGDADDCGYNTSMIMGDLA